MSVVATVLTILAVLLRVFLGVAVFDRSDPAGHAPTQVWAFGEAIALWAERGGAGPDLRLANRLWRLALTRLASIPRIDWWTTTPLLLLAALPWLPVLRRSQRIAEAQARDRKAAQVQAERQTMAAVNQASLRELRALTPAPRSRG